MTDQPKPLSAILLGDARHIPMANETVQCCVTSPPYWGLRDYGLGNKGVGLEPTLDEYIANIVYVFRGVRRVLHPSGVVWLNLGDCFSPQSTHRGTPGTRGGMNQRGRDVKDLIPMQKVLKPKDLVGLPWRVAFALQADGWYLRSDIVWSKPNPMPESVTDRPTRAHEYVFLLTKNARYFYDAEAVAEPGVTGDMRRPYAPGQVDSRGNGHDRGGGELRKQDALGKNTYTGINDRWRDKPTATRNLRTVWTIATQPYRGAHFATYPEKLVEPCIKAGSKPGDIILDPFCGSGTTGAVAQRLGRRFVGIDRQPKYLELARGRIAKAPRPLMP